MAKSFKIVRRRLNEFHSTPQFIRKIKPMSKVIAELNNPGAQGGRQASLVRNRSYPGNQTGHPSRYAIKEAIKNVTNKIGKNKNKDNEITINPQDKELRQETNY